METSPDNSNRCYQLHRSESPQQGSLWSDTIASHHALLIYGCGDGAPLEDFLAETRCGVEADPRLAKEASERGFDIRPSIECFAGRSFDRILLNDPLRELDASNKTLQALRNRLSDDGHLLFSLRIRTEESHKFPRLQAQKEKIVRLLASNGYPSNSMSVRRTNDRTPFTYCGGGQRSLSKAYSFVTPTLVLLVTARLTAERVESHSLHGAGLPSKPFSAERTSQRA